jgi:small subunit ribosomal protein S6
MRYGAKLRTGCYRARLNCPPAPAGRHRRPHPGGRQTTGSDDNALRTYELMIISHGTLSEDAVTGNVERFTNLIGQLGGSVDKVDHWGKREFAYEIDHQRDGWYTVVDFQLDGQQLPELERQLRLTDAVVRHKVVQPAARVRHP